MHSRDAIYSFVLLVRTLVALENHLTSPQVTIYKCSVLSFDFPLGNLEYRPTGRRSSKQPN